MNGYFIIIRKYEAGVKHLMVTALRVMGRAAVAALALTLWAGGAGAFDVSVHRHVGVGDSMVITPSRGRLSVTASRLVNGEPELIEFESERIELEAVSGPPLLGRESFVVTAARARNFEEADHLAARLAAEHGLEATPAFPEEGWRVRLLSRTRAELGTARAFLPPMTDRLLLDRDAAAAALDRLRALNRPHASMDPAPDFSLRLDIKAQDPGGMIHGVLLLRVRALDPEAVLQAKIKCAGGRTSAPSLRGELRLRLDSYGGFTLINRVDIEDYLYGVLPHEIGGNAPIEAQKAQAVVARTYSLKNAHRFLFDGYHLCGDVHCQVYGGAGSETEAARMAVDMTRGQVITYQGELVDALYFSTAGGHTASYAEAFEGEAAGCLVGTFEADPPPDLDLSNESDFARFIAQTTGYYDQDSKYFRWEESFTADRIAALLRDNLDNIGVPHKPFNRVENLLVRERGRSGRILELEIVTDTGGIFVGRDKIRWAFGALKSSMFKVEKSGDGFVFTGGGWGHGVGLCQMGARALARRGFSYERILGHYFPGAELVSGESHPAYSAAPGAASAVVSIRPEAEEAAAAQPPAPELVTLDPAPETASEIAPEIAPGVLPETASEIAPETSPARAPGAIEVLIQTIELEGERNHEVRLKAVRALGRSATPETVELMLRLMREDRSWEIKLAAAAALVQVGESAAGMPALGSGLGHDWWQVRVWACNELDRIIDSAADLALNALEDENAQVRTAAMRALAAASEPMPRAAAAVAARLPLASGSELEAGIAALKAVGSAEHVQALEALLAGGHERSLQIAAAEAALTLTTRR